jgi:hypothetical protein
MKSKVQWLFCLLLVRTSCAGFTANSVRSKARNVSNVPRSGSLTAVQKQKQRNSSNSRLRSLSFITEHGSPNEGVTVESNPDISLLKEEKKSVGLPTNVQETMTNRPAVVFNSACRMSITIFATFLTWWAQKQYSNVLASSSITLISSVVLKKSFSQAAFCGTFAGMSSRAVIPTWQGAIGLGALTSVLFEWLIHTKNMFYGIGGRLGAIAFIATNIVAALIHVPTGVSVSSFQSLLPSLKKGTLVRFAFWHALGSIATIALREASDDSAVADPVRASAVVGLISALFIEDKVAVLALYGGSFVGMSLPSRLLFGIVPGKEKDNESRSIPTFASLFLSFGIAGALGGLIHGASVDWGWWAGGWGGKAGFCSFIGCLVFRTIRKIIR